MFSPSSLPGAAAASPRLRAGDGPLNHQSICAPSLGYPRFRGQDLLLAGDLRAAILLGWMSAGARPFEASRLLSRQRRLVDLTSLAPSFEGSTVFVTGAAGSIGSAICRVLLSLKPARLIILDLSENNLSYLTAELNGFADETVVECVLGSVDDPILIAEVLSEFHPDVVLHTAARKHVPLMEQFPEEAVRTNVGGTVTLARACQRLRIARFVLVSTDKAVRPTSVMGATKRACERFLLDLASQGGPTRFVIVRLGNVLGSDGSVLQIFLRQMALGYPLTITDPEATRYFIDVTEAAHLILRAAAMGKEGEIYMLDMGTPVRIGDLVRTLALSVGMAPESLPIRLIGLRPGERRHEELCGDNEQLEPTDEPGILIVKVGSTPIRGYSRLLSEVLDAATARDRRSTLELLRRAVPEFVSTTAQAPSSDTGADSPCWLPATVAEDEPCGAASLLLLKSV